jgi:hypothetical protein
MSVVRIDHNDEPAEEDDDLEAVDTTDRPERNANLLRSFTPYVPRHRAVGPAL